MRNANAQFLRDGFYVGHMGYVSKVTRVFFLFCGNDAAHRDSQVETPLKNSQIDMKLEFVAGILNVFVTLIPEYNFIPFLFILWTIKHVFGGGALKVQLHCVFIRKTSKFAPCNMRFCSITPLDIGRDCLL